jgi:hypothetical protein
LRPTQRTVITGHGRVRATIDTDHPSSALDPPFAARADIADCVLGETLVVYGERERSEWIRTDAPARSEP